MSQHATRAAGSQAPLARRLQVLLLASLAPVFAAFPALASQPSAADADVILQDIIVRPDRVLVTPTRRDRIGRIWAPVTINGHGPFRMVLDSGASQSAISPETASALGLPLDVSPPVLLRGVTGAATTPTVRVDRMQVGDLVFGSTRLLVLSESLGGADGVLGTTEFVNRRVFVDFEQGRIEIARSADQTVGADFQRIPFRTLDNGLIAIDARVGRVNVIAVIDTGGQTTLANKALRKALFRGREAMMRRTSYVYGVTGDLQRGSLAATPPLQFGDIRIESLDMSFADLHIFEQSELADRPAMLVGMDALGQFGVLVIDYHRSELQIRPRTAG